MTTKPKLTLETCAADLRRLIEQTDLAAPEQAAQTAPRAGEGV